MRETKKLTLSAILCALSVAVLSLGAFIETLDLSLTALTSLVIAFLYIEVGAPYTYLTWLVTSLLTFIIFPASAVWAEYLLIFGIYPILKGYVERLPRIFWLILKLLIFNAMFWLLFLFVTGLLGLPFFDDDRMALKIAMYAISNVAFIVYDLFLTFCARVYLGKFRDKIKKYLKKRIYILKGKNA